MDLGEIPGWGVKLQTEVETLQEAFATHVKDNRDTHKDLYTRTERPSWTLAWVLALLASVATGLGVFVVTH